MDHSPKNLYFFTFIHLQMAIACLSFIRYPHIPPLFIFIPKLILFSVLFLAAVLLIVNGKKLILYLQIISLLGMLAGVMLFIVMDPWGRLLFPVIDGSPYMHFLFNEAFNFTIPASPFNLIWLSNEISYSWFGVRFLAPFFKSNLQVLYYLHAASGFVYWLFHLLLINRWKRSAQQEAQITYPDQSMSLVDMKKSSEIVDDRLKGLHEYYERVLKKDLIGLEQQRKNIASSLINIHVYFSLMIIFSFIFGWFVAIQMSNEEADFGFTVFIIMALVIVGLSIYWPFLVFRIKKNYVQSFKKSIVEKIVHFVNQDLIYEPQKYISPDLFMASGIFRASPSEYWGDDYVSGTIGNLSLAFSEVNAQQRMGQNHVTIFKGLFFVIDCHRSFAGETYILPDLAQGSFGKQLGKLFQSWNTKRGQVISINKAEFEKYFVVYSSDPEAARDILSAPLINRILDYRKSYPRAVYFSFFKNMIFIGLSHPKSIFEPNVYKTLFDFNMITNYYEDFQLALSTAELFE